MSLVKILKENTFSLERFNKLSNFLDKHYFHLVYDRKDKLGYSDYFIGSGVEAMVLKSDKYPDIVLRISHKISKNFQKLEGKKFKNVVEVKFYKELDSITLTVMEKLVPLDRKIVDMINYMKYDLEIQESNNHHIDVEDFLDDIYQNRNTGKILFDNNKNEITGKGYKKGYINNLTFKDIIKFIEDKNNGEAELSSLGINHIDLHFGNIMYDPKSNNHKLIDV